MVGLLGCGCCADCPCAEFPATVNAHSVYSTRQVGFYGLASTELAKVSTWSSSSNRLYRNCPVTTLTDYDAGAYIAKKRHTMTVPLNDGHPLLPNPQVYAECRKPNPNPPEQVADWFLTKQIDHNEYFDDDKVVTTLMQGELSLGRGVVPPKNTYLAFIFAQSSGSNSLNFRSFNNTYTEQCGVRNFWRACGAVPKVTLSQGGQTLSHWLAFYEPYKYATLDSVYFAQTGFKLFPSASPVQLDFDDSTSASTQIGCYLDVTTQSQLTVDIRTVTRFRRYDTARAVFTWPLCQSFSGGQMTVTVPATGASYTVTVGLTYETF